MTAPLATEAPRPPAPRAAGAAPSGLSHDRTTARVLRLLEGLEWRTARVLDVGAGRGRFSHLLAEELRARGLEPRDHVVPVDLVPETFEAEGLECRRTGADGRLPFEDSSFDVVVSIEVVEHVEDPFAFLRELARVARPGGRVVVTTPNVLHLSSRVRNLVWGFPSLFDPLPLAGADVRFLSGHIHPISPYFLALAALRAGLGEVELTTDRVKRSAAAWVVLLSPLLLLARLAQHRRLARRRPDVLAANRELLRGLESWALLTGRTAVLSARKPAR